MNKLILATFICLATTLSYAQDTAANQKCNLHFQTTYIYQYKPSFTAKYSSANSLITSEEKQNSLTATLYASARLWRGAYICLNPEVAGGSGLSGAFGMAGSTNGETFRVGDPAPTLYTARAFLSQTFPLGSQTEQQEDDANQLAGSHPVDYLSFYIGKFSLGDFFDNNEFANGPRTQFLNWAMMNNAAWDYAANTRGYTYSFTTILHRQSMSYKLGIAMLPKTANGPDFNTDIANVYAINAEVSHAYKWHNKDGNIRFLGYLNTANMGNYSTAIGMHTIQPDVVATRKSGNTKYGWGINIDQQLSTNIGAWARLGWNDGKTETWCFTEADATVSLGLNLDGNLWKRKEDNIGVGIVANGISKDHRNYLAKGGYGFQLGDGALTYAPESILELYYSCKPNSNGIWLSGDYQLAFNPGYNADRGPLQVFSFRVHVAL